MAHLYADFYQKRYKVSCCSMVSIVYLVFLLACLAIPYFLCWVSRGK
jgi:hypothetical protein